MKKANFLEVTELSGDLVSKEQLDRLCQRYYWSVNNYCRGKDVVEVACGTGQGLGLLQSVSSSLVAGDCSEEMVDIAKAHYGDRVDIRCFDAAEMPFETASKDVVLICEAIYYLPDIERFLTECRRVLRPTGHLLIVTANKELFDFNSSPHSTRYYGVEELNSLLRAKKFAPVFYGAYPTDKVSLKQRFLRPIKYLAAKGGFIPKTMEGKKRLKRLVFGKMVKMPYEIDFSTSNVSQPIPLFDVKQDRKHKVIFCAGRVDL